MAAFPKAGLKKEDYTVIQDLTQSMPQAFVEKLDAMVAKCYKGISNRNAMINHAVYNLIQQTEFAFNDKPPAFTNNNPTNHV